MKYIKITSFAQTKGMRQLSNRLSSVDSVVDTDNSGICISLSVLVVRTITMPLSGKRIRGRKAEELGQISVSHLN